MKRYRLIIKYPSLADGIEEGDVFTKRKPGDGYIGKEPAHFVSAKEVENGKRFWEKVIEKNYEILTVSEAHPSKKYIHKVSGCKVDTPYSNEAWSLTLYELLKNGTALIHSVKRLKDGEIFTIGDKCKWQGNGCSDTGVISYITLKNNVIMISNDSCTFHLKFISHVKKPLFTTEDGVDIFEGDRYYLVRKSKVHKHYIYFTYLASNEGMWKTVNECYLFKSLDETNNFIKAKQSLFKTKDNADIFEGDSYYKVEIKQGLAAIVKNKASVETSWNSMSYDTIFKSEEAAQDAAELMNTYTYEQVYNIYTSFSSDKKVTILLDAVEYMSEYNGRTKIQCIALAMGYENPSGEPDQFIKTKRNE